MPFLVRMHMSLLALLALPATAAAQTDPVAAAQTDPVAAAQPAEVSATVNEDVPACELHVFPTENYLGFNSGLLSGFGALGALADMSAHEKRVATVTELMKGYLDPEIQVEELRKQDLVRKLNLTGDYRIIVEPPTPSGEAAKGDPALKAKVKAINADIKAGKRLTTSTNKCYAEFILFSVFYHKAMMYGSNLFVPMMLRDYGDGLARPVTSAGAVKNPLEAFPPKTPDAVDVAKAELRDAFSRDFVEWTEKKLVRPGAATAP